jgi:S1-C subfamily serine protease
VPPLLIAACLAAPQPPAPAEADAVPVAVKKAVPATVRVTTLGTDFRVASGVVVDVHGGIAYVLTANHALGQGGEYQVEFFSPDKQGVLLPELTTQPTDITVSSSDRQATADFAILKVALRRQSVPNPVKSDSAPEKSDTPPAVTFARLAPPLERPKRFPTQAFAVGCDLPKDMKPSLPTVTATTLIGKRLKRAGPDRAGSEMAILWETETPHAPGRSGGPLLDKDGRVIGICLANDTGINHGLFTHLDEIQAWMKKNGYAWVVDNK